MAYRRSYFVVFAGPDEIPVYCGSERVATEIWSAFRRLSSPVPVYVIRSYEPVLVSGIPFIK
ncbi:hypothetical protein [Dipodfec virus UOA04_Rod_815]|nr:hypothetical protein [Dipodfec virus UOA04_Rod_815]